MELLNRYRSVTVLLLVIFAQLVLLAYQVKGQGDVRLIRLWAVTAITPAAKVIESTRSGIAGLIDHYVSFKDLNGENKQLRSQLAKLKLENQFLRTELQTADRVHALNAFQSTNPAKTLTVRVIATGTGANSKVVFIDHGSRAGVMRGMAVITPDGIVGKVIASYPMAAQVLLITDPTFAAGVISQKHRMRGTVRGMGRGNCTVDFIQNEEQVDVGEKFFTSGDDGIFPRGLPVGAVTAVRPGAGYKQIYLEPSGLQAGIEEVLVVLEGVHLSIPELTEPSKEAKEVYIQPPPPEPAGQANTPAGQPAAPSAQQGSAQPPVPAHLMTEADKLREQYKQIGDAQGHVFGQGLPGSKPPDFNLTPEEAAARARAKAAAAAAVPGAKPGPTGAPPGAPKPEPPKPASPTPPTAKPQAGSKPAVQSAPDRGGRPDADPLPPSAFRLPPAASAKPGGSGQ